MTTWGTPGDTSLKQYFILVNFIENLSLSLSLWSAHRMKEQEEENIKRGFLSYYCQSRPDQSSPAMSEPIGKLLKDFYNKNFYDEGKFFMG